MIATTPGIHPFPGLRPFEPEEDYLFFGREDQTDDLLRRLRRHRFLAVVGASGSGKSSLVRAGLLPALHGGFMVEAGSRWRVAIFRPGGNPIHALARALVAPEVYGTPEPDGRQLAFTEATLRRGARGLVDVVRETRPPADENLLVVVDQFEELFRFKKRAEDQQAGDHATAFVKLLLEAARSERAAIYVVLTMRSDFLGDCAQFRDLPEAINDAQFLVPRMTRTQRRLAIEGPVAVGGATVAPRLVQRLLNDVGDDPDQLPILQHALMRTWEHWAEKDRPDEPLDLSDYEAIGGMATALSRHANEVYAELPDDRHRTIAERIFKRLTDRDLDGRGIRRPTSLAELTEVADATPEEIITVVEAFRRPDRALLMPPAGTALEPETMIDISHESLMRVWDRLQWWVKAEATSAQTYRRLAETAVRWEAGNASLWRGPELRQTNVWARVNQPNEAWAARYHDKEWERSKRPVFPLAMRFLEKSRALQGWRAALTVGISVLLLVAAFAGAFGLTQQNLLTEARVNARLAEEQSQRAEALAEVASSALLATRALTRLDDRYDQSLLLSVAAYQTSPTPEAQSTLYTTLQHSPRLQRILYAQDDGVLAAAISPDGNRLASSGVVGSVWIWDAATGTLIKRYDGTGTAVQALAFSPDGRNLAAGNSQGQVRLWGPGDTPRSFPAHEDAILTLAFSPDGQRLATAGYDARVRLWDVATGRLLETLEGHERRVQSLAFSPDGNTLASGAQDSRIILWNARTGARESSIKINGYAFSLAFNPRHPVLASGGRDYTVGLFQANTGDSLATLKGHESAVYSVAFSPDGERLASAGADKVIRLWNAAYLLRKRPVELVEILTGHSNSVRSVAFFPDGETLVSGSADGTLMIWDLTLPHVAKRFEGEKDRSVALLARAGTRLASYGNNGAVRVWDLDAQRVLAEFMSEARVAAFDANGERLLTVDERGIVQVWDVGDATPTTFESLGAIGFYAAFSPDGTRLAAPGPANTVRLWSLESGQLLARYEGHQAEVLSVAFNEQGTRLASADDAGTVRLWDAENPENGEVRQALATDEGHKGRIFNLAFSPDGVHLASAGEDATIRLWDLTARGRSALFEGHEEAVLDLAFSPDGTRLGSASADKTTRMWSTETGQALATYEGHNSKVLSVIFNEDGTRLISVDEDGLVLWWTDVDPALLPERFCRTANRNLTQAEWEKFMPAGLDYRCTCPELLPGDDTGLERCPG